MINQNPRDVFILNVSFSRNGKMGKRDPIPFAEEEEMKRHMAGLIILYVCKAQPASDKRLNDYYINKEYDKMIAIWQSMKNDGLNTNLEMEWTEEARRIM